MTRHTDIAKKTLTQIPAPRRAYPFTAIVGQAELKLALLLNVIAPSIGGVLIMGHRGTGKSTAVRALAELLPPLARVRDCLYGCEPTAGANLCHDCRARLASAGKLSPVRAPVRVVELPLNATEDRVAGTINFERAITEGFKTFEPGLLARAHRGFLYIDEVNLLEDHLVDLLLDVAASGRNRVEREGLSVEHPAEFVLVGSGNPEEGELRPQLLDRFGLYTEIRTAAGIEERVEIVMRREEFDRDPASFCERREAEQSALRRRLVRARAAFKNVRLSKALVRSAAELCQRLGVDGHRGELTVARAARALAAFENRKEATAEDVRRVATMALGHRLRRDPLEQAGGGSQIEQAARELFGAGEESTGDKGRDEAKAETGGARQGQPAGDPAGETDGDDKGGQARPSARRSREGSEPSATGETQQSARALDAQLPPRLPDDKLRIKTAHTVSTPQGKRQASMRASADARRGRYARAVASRTVDAKIALDATVRAAVASQTLQRRAASSARALRIEKGDLRYKRFSRRAGTLFIFAVDTSGSMAVGRIAQAKGALARLLRQSYVNRDRVSLITFREREARVLLQPCASGARAKKMLDALPVGGATPLTDGLLCALEVSARAARQGAQQRIVLLVFTDGRANVPRTRGLSEFDPAAVRRLIASEVEKIGVALRRLGVASVIVDTQNRFTTGGEGQRLATALGGCYVHLSSAR